MSWYEKMSTSLSGKGVRELRELSTQREQSKQSNSTEQEHRVMTNHRQLIEVAPDCMSLVAKSN